MKGKEIPGPALALWVLVTAAIALVACYPPESGQLVTNAAPIGEPMPYAQENAHSRTEMAWEKFPATIPAKPRTNWILWAWAGSGPVYFEVWHSTNLTAWERWTNVAECAVRMPNDKPKEFFKVRAVNPNNGLASGWATR